MSKPKLSIIICCYNRWNFTKKVINDLSFLPENEIEIIIIDNNSSDETKIRLQALNKNNIKCIFNIQNNWHSGGSNQGYAIATSDNILFLNNDIKIQEKTGWINVLVDALDNNPNCIVGPTGGFIDPKDDFKFKYETQDANKLINYISGWCIAAKKSTWEKLKQEKWLGPLDEQNFPMYYNDSNCSIEATKMGIGLKLIQLPIYHIGKISSSQLNVYALYNSARQKFLEKWKEK